MNRLGKLYAWGHLLGIALAGLPGCALRQRPTMCQKPAPAAAAESKPQASQVSLAGYQSHAVEVQRLPAVVCDDPFVGHEYLTLDVLVENVLARNRSLEAMFSAWRAAAQRYPQVVALD